jgi:ribosomal protein S18 acetylase RimI-like enzyme
MLPGYSIVELCRRTDSLLPDWLDLYETSFPPRERLLVSSFLRLLEKKEQGKGENIVLSALLDEQGRMAAMAAYQIFVQPPTGYLWYIAVSPALRGNGLGTAYYQAIVEKVFQFTEVLLFEVEMPEHCTDAEMRRLAERRIVFYQRNGAALLTGIHYLQSVGSHVPPTPMHLMVHARRPIQAQEAYEIARGIFGEAVSQVGPLALSGFQQN